MSVIKKLVLDLDGVEVSLTPEQAQKLYEALDELFAAKVVEKHVPYYVPYQVPHYTPFWIYNPPIRITTTNPDLVLNTTDPIWYTTTANGTQFSLNEEHELRCKLN